MKRGGEIVGPRRVGQRGVSSVPERTARHGPIIISHNPEAVDPLYLFACQLEWERVPPPVPLGK